MLTTFHWSFLTIQLDTEPIVFFDLNQPSVALCSILTHWSGLEQVDQLLNELIFVPRTLLQLQLLVYQHDANLSTTCTLTTRAGPSIWHL